MKRTLFALVMLIPLLSGCANVNTDITINKDNSAEVVTEITYDGNLANNADSVAKSIMNNYKNFIDNNYKVEKTFKENKSTIKAARKVLNLSVQDLDLTSLGFASNLESGRFIEVKKNFLIASYNIDLLFDYENNSKKIIKNEPNVEDTSSVGLKPEYYQRYGDMSELENFDREDSISANLDEDTKNFINNTYKITDSTPTNEDENIDMVLNIKVPAFASYNNADSSKGNVYTWNLKKDEATEIKLQYVKYSGFAITFVLLLGASLLAYMARKILKHENQKRIDNVNNIV